MIMTDAAGDKSWPVAGSTFILMQAVPTDAADSAAALKFFDWGYKNGKQMAEDLDYVPMPDSVVALIEKTWKDKIKATDGKPVSRSTRAGKGAASGAFSFSTTIALALRRRLVVTADRPLD